MTSDHTLRALRDAMRDELTTRILPFWLTAASDRQRGGVIGLIDEDGTPHPDAPKGAILHARVLWTFSAAYRALGDEVHRREADRAAVHFASHFVDPTFGGAFWMLDARGRPMDERKHVYAQAFAIYALAEHFRATADERSLHGAIAIFRLVESHAYDAGNIGYDECFSRAWTPLEDVRLSEQDLNERRSMNTHLHLLEAYTTLHAAWPDPHLAGRIRTLLELFLDRIIAPEGDRVVAFFTERWEPRSAKSSFGHDVETSWLLVEGAHALGDPALTERVRAAAMRLSAAVLDGGLDAEHGGLFYERDAHRLDTDKEWWPQAEAIVGFLAAYQDAGDARYLDAAMSTWRFIERHLADRRNGEWFRRVSREGDRTRGGEKVGPWKCPYHNGRACLEVIARVDALLASEAGGVAV
jgi:mannobiose 2-epimerase